MRSVSSSRRSLGQTRLRIGQLTTFRPRQHKVNFDAVASITMQTIKAPRLRTNVGVDDEVARNGRPCVTIRRGCPLQSCLPPPPSCPVAHRSRQIEILGDIVSPGARFRKRGLMIVLDTPCGGLRPMTQRARKSKKAHQPAMG